MAHRGWLIALLALAGCQTASRIPITTMTGTDAVAPTEAAAVTAPVLQGGSASLGSGRPIGSAYHAYRAPPRPGSAASPPPGVEPGPEGRGSIHPQAATADPSPIRVAGQQLASPVPEAAAAYCEAVDAYLKPTDCDRIAIQKAHLIDGVAAFDPPAAMTVGMAQDVTLTVGRPQHVAEVMGDRDASTRTVTFKAKLGSHMTARLVGSAFDIQPDTPEEQDLGGARSGLWSWRVTPKTAGPAQSLLLTVFTNALDSNGKPTTLELASRKVSVAVRVSSAQRRKARTDTAKEVLGDGQGLFAGLKGLLVAATGAVAAAAGLYWAVRRFRQPPAPSGSGPAPSSGAKV